VNVSWIYIIYFFCVFLSLHTFFFIIFLKSSYLEVAIYTRIVDRVKSEIFILSTSILLDVSIYLSLHIFTSVELNST